MLRTFLDWLLEAPPQRRPGCAARTFRRRSAWCWDLEPHIGLDGVVHRAVMADGTGVNGWCLLTAIDGEDGEVLAWQWCARENTTAYRALFAQLAPPDVLVCDGMKGILKACAQIWPGTRIQRCLIHVPRDSNRLEGGPDAALKRMLVNHRGLPKAHMRRACEWHCHMHSAKPDPAHILKQHDQDTKTGTNHDNNDDEPMSQPTLGTGIDWNEFHTSTRYPDTTD